jgi:hypothetical protein|tara:strand:- start:41 stop:466 length:426 start_codon:yes stop_codon:yes gene_type:complete
MSVTINNLGLDGGNPFDVYIDKTNAREAMFKLIKKDKTQKPDQVTTYIVELHDADGEVVKYKIYENWDRSNSRFDSSIPETPDNKVYNIYQALYKDGEFVMWTFRNNVYDSGCPIANKRNTLLDNYIVKFVKSNSNLAHVK